MKASNYIKIISIIIFIGLVNAQDITNKLGGDTANETYDVTDSNGDLLFRVQGDGKVGIGTLSNNGSLDVDGTVTIRDNFLLSGAFFDYNLNAGTAGQILSSTGASVDWIDAPPIHDAVTIGTANGLSLSGQQISLSAATTTNAGAMRATDKTKLDKIASDGTTASYSSSTAIGDGTTASGYFSTAMGRNTEASGFNSTAMGYYTTASGDGTTAMGNNASTAGFNGAFAIGDNSTNTDVVAVLTNQMVMRFNNGYRLFTNAAMTTGTRMGNGANSWSSISDSTKKENYQNADGEYFLDSIAKLRLGSWNYKSQNAKDFRHYGPMAQEIFHYFGKDDYGTIGNDTTLPTADMDGIMMIALQALEKRTAELNQKNKELNIENELLRQRLIAIERKLGL